MTGNPTPDKNTLTASKKLNRLKPFVTTPVFCLEVFWCRTAYDGIDQWNTSFHQHSFFELHLALSGDARFTTQNNSDTALSPGEFLLLAPGTQHRVAHTNGAFSEFVLAFQFTQGTELEQTLRRKTTPCYTGRSTPAMRQMIDHMLRQAYHEAFGYGTAVSSYLACFFLEAFQMIAGADMAEPAPACLLENDDRLQIAKRFIADNLAKPIRVGDVARQANVSVRHLNRIVSQAENCSVSALIRTIRIQHVKKQLKTTKRSLSELAAECGFSDAFQLSRAFKQVEGTPPGRYRRDINR